VRRKLFNKVLIAKTPREICDFTGTPSVLSKG
jgi:hypothetical protein